MKNLIFPILTIGAALSAQAFVAHDSTNRWNVADGDASVAANYLEQTLPGANAQVRIANGGTMRIGSDLSWGALWAGYGGNARVVQTAGHLTLSNAGSASGDGTLWLGYNASDSGVYDLKGGVLEVTANNNNPQIGRSGTGLLSISGGTFIARGYPSVARLDGGNGRIDVFGTGKADFRDAQQVSVGEGGAGAVTVRSGGLVEASKIVLGVGSSARGQLNVASGGVVRATSIQGGSGTCRRLNATGGTIEPRTSGTKVSGYLDKTDVVMGAGGLTIDTAGKAMTLAAPLKNGGLRQADLAHRWSFNGDLTDSVGGQTATKEGSKAGEIVFADGQLKLPGTEHHTAFVALGASIVPADCDGATIEIWATQDEARSWSRVFTSRGDGDAKSFMTWAWDANPNGDIAQCWGSSASNMLSPWTPGTEFHIVIRMFQTTEGAWAVEYSKRNAVTGAQIKRYTWTVAAAGWSPAKFASSEFNVGWSTDPGNYDACARYNEIRVWKRALTDEELMESATLGPDADFTGTADLVKTGDGALTLAAGNTYDGATRVDEGLLSAGAFALPIHRWSFNGSYADSLGGATVQPLGDEKAGIVLGENVVTLPGAEHTKARIELGSGLWSGCTEGFTFEFWVRPDKPLTWSRIFTCVSGQYTCRSQPRLFMTLVGGSGTDSGKDFVGVQGGDADGWMSGNKMAPWTIGQWFHVAVVGSKQPDGKWNLLFLKSDAATGTQLKRFSADAESGWCPEQFAEDGFNLGWSTDGGNYDAAATYDEVRIWNRSMSEAELAESARLGPDRLPAFGAAGATGALPAATDLKVADGARFALAGAAQTVRSVAGEGTVEGPGTLTATETIRPSGDLTFSAGAKVVGAYVCNTGGRLVFAPGATYDVSGLKVVVDRPETIAVDSPVSIMTTSGATLSGAFDLADPSMVGLKLTVKLSGEVLLSRRSGMVMIFR